MSQRAEALAFRLEAGAAMLAELAEQLTDTEWNTKVRDGRTVGVIVHHVASMYPIEIDAAKTIASGKPFVGVGWDVIAEINANHARENKSATKAEAIALLKRNAHDAATAVRKFTDAELDTAAPFSLSYDAPMTAQFVIEDHAMRHSFHHLSRIKDVLPRVRAVAA